jgi:hypothetical protein
MAKQTKPPAGRPFLRNRASFNGKGRKKALDFFRDCPWDEWWMEFITSRRKDGRLTYVSAYQFAKAKAKTVLHLSLIYRAIGPKPLTLGGLHERTRGPEPQNVPYLGDWQQLRAKAYFYDNESVDKMRHLAAERLDALEAGRGAATIVLDMIEKWMKYDDKLDEVFDGTPVVEGLSDDEQDKRASRFYRLKERSVKGLLVLLDKYLACHGIAHDGLNDLGALVMAVNNSAAKGCLCKCAAVDPYGKTYGQVFRAQE